MLPFENMVADYVKETANHVLYRVTPIFEGDNAVAAGVLMEAESVEEDDILFCVFCYNVQPGIEIDYATGDSREGTEQVEEITSAEETEITETVEEIQVTEYVLNTNTKKFHYPTCSSVSEMADNKKQYYTGTRDEIIDMGYVPCKRCNP